MNYYAALILGVLVILGYTLLGGYLAVVATDFLQGTLMFFALVMTGVIAVFAIGGPAHTFEQLSQFGQHFINRLLHHQEPAMASSRFSVPLLGGTRLLWHASHPDSLHVHQE